MKHFFPGL